ncbi:hypothetical protein LRS10_13255 [Phenylobacterium sp. J426]|uniref:hypothetical protein n=1 Tax=Phenylobacterium sp. J426 TaxID=2898439 RepID=UPI0021514B7F|nr:hypothetical protein [Phenylobacterium sp. J426]MCR5875064.1 hypothetical protein [Phenylobacterium sp. J426]
MTETLRRALTHRIATLAAATAALVMGVLLAISWSSWTAERSALERRISELTQQADRSQSLWKAQLAACHAAADPDKRLTEAAYEAPADTRAAARRLLTERPEGIDVCARMESADQAVLSTLQ